MPKNKKNNSQDSTSQSNTSTHIKKKNSKKVSTVTIVTVTVLSVILITAMVVFGVLYHLINQIPYVPDETDLTAPPLESQFETDDLDGWLNGIDQPGWVDGDDTGDSNNPGGDSPTVTLPPEVNHEDVKLPTVDPINTDGLINILLVGQDRRSGQGRQRSDSMILVSINPDKKKVAMISFLRDLYVKIPGDKYADNKMNAAYAFGGFKLLKETFKVNFGITIDGCFECDFYDFIDIINILGGVEVNVTQKESDYLKSTGVEVPAGTSTLNGRQALAYARIRKIDSDFQRTTRQRTIMLSIFNKFKHASVNELWDIANTILPKLASDMDNSQKLSLLTKLLPLAGSMEVKSYSVPFSGAYKDAIIRKMMVLVPDLPKIRSKLVNDYLPF